MMDAWMTMFLPAVDMASYYRERAERLVRASGGEYSPRLLFLYLEVREEIERERNARLLEIPAKAEISEFLSRAGLRGEVSEEHLEAYAWPFVHLTRGECDLARVLLELRAAGTRVAVLANSPHHGMVEERVRREGISDLIDLVETSASLGYRKPHPRAFLGLLSRLGEGAGGSVMVGDSASSDVEGAASVGMKTVWVRRPGSKRPRKVDAIIDTLEELPEVVERLIG